MADGKPARASNWNTCRKVSTNNTGTTSATAQRSSDWTREGSSHTLCCDKRRVRKGPCTTEPGATELKANGDGQVFWVTASNVNPGATGCWYAKTMLGTAGTKRTVRQVASRDQFFGSGP